MPKLSIISGGATSFGYKDGKSQLPSSSPTTSDTSHNSDNDEDRNLHSFNTAFRRIKWLHATHYSAIIMPSIQRQRTIRNRQRTYPAVIGWPGKYKEGGGNIQDDASGPRVVILGTEFQIQKASPTQLQKLDVAHWPTWTTSDKSKCGVGNLVVDKEMPYGVASYVLSGKLEIIPQSTGVPEIVSVGDFVTFPKGFVASWKVLEELTWHYYLY